MRTADTNLAFAVGQIRNRAVFAAQHDRAFCHGLAARDECARRPAGRRTGGKFSLRKAGMGLRRCGNQGRFRQAVAGQERRLAKPGRMEECAEFFQHRGAHRLRSAKCNAPGRQIERTGVVVRDHARAKFIAEARTARRGGAEFFDRTEPADRLLNEGARRHEDCSAAEIERLKNGSDEAHVVMVGQPVHAYAVCVMRERGGDHALIGDKISMRDRDALGGAGRAGRILHEGRRVRIGGVFRRLARISAKPVDGQDRRRRSRLCDTRQARFVRHDRGRLCRADNRADAIDASVHVGIGYGNGDGADIQTGEEQSCERTSRRKGYRNRQTRQARIHQALRQTFDLAFQIRIGQPLRLGFPPVQEADGGMRAALARVLQDDLRDRTKRLRRHAAPRRLIRRCDHGPHLRTMTICG
jgi:hypothetical protein